MDKINADDHPYGYLYEKNPLTEAMARLGFFACDVENRKAMCNELWRSWGYDEGDMMNQRLREICHPDDRGIVERLFSAMKDGQHGMNQEIFRIRTVDGRWVWVRHCGLTVSRTGEGGIGLYVGHDSDLSDMKEAEDRLRLMTAQSGLHAKEMETLSRAASIITSSLDVDEAVKLILEQAKIVVPYDKASVQVIQNGGLELIGGNGFTDIAAVRGKRFPYPSPGSMSTVAIDEKRVVVCKDVTRDFPGFVMAERDNPTRSWMGIPLIAHGDVFGLLSFNHSQEGYFTERHAQLASGFAVHVAIALENARLHERTFKLAMEDALMGIGSRHLFNLQGTLMYENARRKKTVLSIAMVDLDHFKAINDTYGHDAGDSVLKKIGCLCRQDCRVTDLVARYGGEEIVFLFQETDIETAVMISERFRRLIGGSDFGLGGKSITISTGIAAEVPDQGGSIADLLKRADSALYAAKKNGRNRTEVYGAD